MPASIKALDAAIKAAAQNDIISAKEAKPLVDIALKAVKRSGNKARTTAAVFDRFDKMANNDWIRNDRVVAKLAKAVKELSDNEKTFTPVGVRSQSARDGVTRGGSRPSASRTGGSKSSSSSTRSGGSKSSGGSSVRDTPTHRPAPASGYRSGGSKSSGGGSIRSGGGK